ncbi:MAG: hypothetical protein Q4G03_02325 [Planctomycetia bacterium]|nr:hypothetical protein [Planctomycetia bacterium]
MSTTPSNFLFRFQIPCRRFHGQQAAWSKTSCDALDASYSLPFWTRYDQRRDPYGRRVCGANEPSSPENANIFDFRIAWSHEGLYLATTVGGKKKQDYWSSNDLRDADSLRLCLDMRDVKDLRRATRFCHKFIFYPTVGFSKSSTSPQVEISPINRAKDLHDPIDPESITVVSKLRKDGYALAAFIPREALTGFNPEEFNRFGMHFAVRDSQYGLFSLQHGDPLPYEDDPSLWSSFVMEK